MERLTKPTVGCFRYDLKDHKHEIGEFATYDAFFNYSMAVKKLGEYEATGIPPNTLDEMLNDAYDTGYQSCLRAKGLSWTEAEELQRYREAKADPVHAAGGCYCNECRYGLDYDGKITCTEWRGMLHKPDDFCSVGRRREASQ